jgi:cytochrome c553
MNSSITLLLAALLVPWHVALADKADADPRPPGDDWGRMTAERQAVLKLTGDVERSKEAFRVCRGCHKNDGAGVTNGTYPRLTGQHASVIIKQITDVRAGIRSNPKMEPFSSKQALGAQEIADIAVFLEQLETTRESGRGPEGLFARGRDLYAKNGCATCHGAAGQGDAARAYPAVAAQHYGYLLREMEHIQERSRGNSHPDMVRSLAGLSQQDLMAVADYLSRLPDHRLAAREKRR